MTGNDTGDTIPRSKEDWLHRVATTHEEYLYASRKIDEMRMGYMIARTRYLSAITAAMAYGATSDEIRENDPNA